MATLKTDDVKKIAHLARLSIDEEDIPAYATNLNDILEFVGQMSAVNTDKIEPMAHPQTDATQRFRKDKKTEEDHRDEYQAIAPKVKNGLYLVPRVVE